MRDCTTSRWRGGASLFGERGLGSMESWPMAIDGIAPAGLGGYKRILAQPPGGALRSEPSTMPIHPLGFDFEKASAKAFHGKSAGFRAIETALQHYLGQPAAWVNLKALQRAIAEWRATKAGASIRDPALARLDVWLQQEVAALAPWPAPEPGWDARHNCYAYAMHCKVGVDGNNARPGRLAGRPRATKESDFAQGVIDDARHQGRGAWILRQAAPPAPVPQPLHGGYLVAMTSMPHGYHFLRRDEATGLWTHKNGSIRPVETSWRDPDDHLLEDAIDDAALLRLVTDSRLMDSLWHFDAYIEVQNGGLTVSGAPLPKKPAIPE